jgi:hypothetical protein
MWSSTEKLILPPSIGRQNQKNTRGTDKNPFLCGVGTVEMAGLELFIISTTVSDPDYVRTESEFLLNLNRVNVAISRMKKKLVIVASRSIFEFMPQDARDYDKALLWRGMSETVGFTADSTPLWKGSLSQLLGQSASEVNVEVYVKTGEP